MKIFYISPYRADKNIGKALNEAIEGLDAGSEDWICHCDMDVMWLRPDSKKQLEEILSATDFDILGPTTNRLGLDYQLAEGLFDVVDIKVHIDVANRLHEQNYGKVVEIDRPLAAFCLCFKVKTWEKLGGFIEKNIQFDWLFSEMARKNGMRLGFMRGIYLFHLYRMGKDKNDFSHLL